ncbi:MAG: hypothetical protein IJ480_05590 [Clostridia bacterium]|nr:hypothetical protein [Clostridia bacterium]
MRNWMPMILTLLFLWVCMILALPGPVSASLTPYVPFVTAAGWIAVALILVFLAYVVYTAKKR